MANVYATVFSFTL